MTTTTSPTPPTPPAAAAVCQSIVIPAYFYPPAGGLWRVAGSLTPGVSSVIANVNSGPGAVLDANYAAAITQARADGLQVFGYVHTSYGAVDRRSIETQIALWSSLYDVTSIFLDEASTSGSQLPYYAALTDHVHARTPTARTIVNFGTIPAESALAAGDVIVTYEGDAATYLDTAFPAWMARHPAGRFYTIVHGATGQATMQAVLAHAAAANVANVYVTDDQMPDPYDVLPSYLAAEAAQVRAHC